MYRSDNHGRDDGPQQSLGGHHGAPNSNDNNAAVALTHLANAAAMSPQQLYHPSAPPSGLQPAFHGSHHTPASPPNGLPPLAPSYARSTPTKTYDPIRDEESSTTPRGTTRYDPIGQVRRDPIPPYSDPRVAASSVPAPPPYEPRPQPSHSPNAANHYRPSPLHLPPSQPQQHQLPSTASIAPHGRSDNLPPSPRSPAVYSSYHRRDHSHPSPTRPQPVIEAAPRRADPMSLSNIMSGSSTTPAHVYRASQPPAPAQPSASPRPAVQSLKEESLAPAPIHTPSAPVHIAAKIAPAPATLVESKKINSKLTNGHANFDHTNGDSDKKAWRQEHKKHRSSSPPKIARPNYNEMMARLRDIDENEPEFQLEHEAEWHATWLRHNAERRQALDAVESRQRKRRRTYHANRFMKIFEGSATRGKDEYHRQNEGKAWKEVQAQEILEEKERKKDMQRKRRREKALQQESQRHNEAMERLQNADEGEEREKAIREVAKHEKKIRHTELLLSGKEIPKELRDVTPQGPNLEGGIMGSFNAAEEAKAKKNTAARMSTRPRKSKEKKQAQIDQAAAAQAAIDRGEELPAATDGATVAVSAMPAARKADKSDKSDKSKSKDSKKGSKDSKRKSLKDVKEEVSTPDEVPEEPSTPVATRIEPFTSKVYNQIYESIWKDISKKDIGKVCRIKNDSTNTKASNLRKTAQLAGKEARRFQLRTNKGTKEVQARAKRSMREMTTFWRRNERDERDQRKMAERQELENAKRLEAEREAARQRRKLNFLISQTELYSHFIGKKVKTQELERSTDDTTISDAHAPSAETRDLPDEPHKVGAKVTNFEDLDFDDEDETALRAAAMANAQNAIQEAKARAQEFDEERADDMSDGEMNFQNPTSLQKMDVSQPKLLSCQLKEYQLKGLNWLCNLYEQGINGILADEMGLGKTVQSISVMAYLAEVHNIWGPFLVVAPASTLHNWQQEIAKFVPEFKVLPYWGAARDRKVLRKFWDRKHMTYRKDADFHVLVTSYQIVVQDTSYFQRMTWQYMILDEAQAIKSSSSSRWKSLLQFHCRNRLLLTGTPIQNNMQELWALLHFIMPTLFDSHDEFSEWFSKDIESHAQSNTKLNEDQLKRLHMILKPFMLRRVKKHVQKELGDKIELDLFCDLTYRQRAYYSSLRNKISLMDLIEKAQMGDDQDAATLMNLVMQFRKVCNHPDLFERADTSAPFSFSAWAETASFSREGNNVQVAYSVRNCVEYNVARLVYRDGRLNLPGPNNTKAGWRNKALYHMMNIYAPAYIAKSAREDGAFSWLRFADVSAGEVYNISRQDVFQRAVGLKTRGRQLGRFRALYDDRNGNDYSPTHALFNVAELNDLSPLAELTHDTDSGLAKLLNLRESSFKASGLSVVETAARPGATAPPVTLYCSSQSTNYEIADTFFNVQMRTALYDLPQAVEDYVIEHKLPSSSLQVAHSMLPLPDQRKARYTHITVPSMRRFVSDCGKLARLDLLLKELKEGGHRVLLYFQMTRMIDMMEEYLTYRNYTYCRLDGSTKLEDRRDTVADFQTRPDIFIFLLSTRAGGLGINLVAADTVIFYDSDWNPTIDSQAMDRAHRLGQTRQVTVYRMITRGTIEERIRKRALQKEEVQRVVISGQSNAGSGIDFNTRSRENRTKDIALWLADDDQAEEIEKREAEALARGDAGDKKGVKKRKRAVAESLEDMYHEGEGRFEDSAKPSGAATPVEAAGPPAKRKRGGKKAKTMKERLAIADGEVNF